jgi:hypothetical protein
MCILAPDPNQPQIVQNPAKPAHARPKTIKEKSLDFLGFSWCKRAFSTGYRDPMGQKSCLAPFPRNWPRKACAFVPEHAPKITRASDFHKQNAWANFADDGGGSAFHHSPGDQADSVETRHALARLIELLHGDAIDVYDTVVIEAKKVGPEAAKLVKQAGRRRVELPIEGEMQKLNAPPHANALPQTDRRELSSK